MGWRESARIERNLPPLFVCVREYLKKHKWNRWECDGPNQGIPRENVTKRRCIRQANCDHHR